MAESHTLPELVSAEQVAKAVGVSIITIRRWVDAGDFPPPIRFGRRVLRWRADAIDAWLVNQHAEQNNAVEEKA